MKEKNKISVAGGKGRWKGVPKEERSRQMKLLRNKAKKHANNSSKNKKSAAG